MRFDRLHAAFVLLSLITILLLVYSVKFFLASPVQTQFGAWVRQIAQVSTNADAELAPLPTHDVPELQPSPTATPTMTAEQLAALVPTAGPTQTPVYRVIEEPVPDGSLVIPSLGIDRPIVLVPVKNQTWDLEGLDTNIGWLQTTGSRPLDNLAMVLVGHVTLPPPGGAGPFLDLGSLRIGDELIYHNNRGKTYTYKVLSQKIVQPYQVEYLYQPDGKRLLLVTCTGYDPLEWDYDLRLVVEAELVNDGEKTAPQ